MKKLIIVPAFIIVCLLLTHCKSDMTYASEQAKQDSLKKESEKPDTITISNEASKFLTPPPDADYTGDYIDRYPNGIIKFTGFFRFGKRHGQWIAFFDNGIKWSECVYDNGKRNGASMVYYPNGRLQYSGWFKNDLRDSIWVFYDEAGKESDKRAYREDQETGLVN